MKRSSRAAHGYLKCQIVNQSRYASVPCQFLPPIPLILRVLPKNWEDRESKWRCCCYRRASRSEWTCFWNAETDDSVASSSQLLRIRVHRRRYGTEAMEATASTSSCTPFNVAGSDWELWLHSRPPRPMLPAPADRACEALESPGWQVGIASRCSASGTGGKSSAAC